MAKSSFHHTHGGAAAAAAAAAGASKIDRMANLTLTVNTFMLRLTLLTICTCYLVPMYYWFSVCHDRGNPKGSYGDREDCKVKIWWMDKNQNYVNTFYNTYLLSHRSRSGSMKSDSFAGDFKRNVIYSDSIIAKKRKVFAETWSGPATSGSFCTAIKRSALPSIDAIPGETIYNYYFLSPIPVDSSGVDFRRGLWISDAVFADNSINIANVYLSISSHCTYNRSSSPHPHSGGSMISSATSTAATSFNHTGSSSSSSSSSRDFDSIGSAYAVLCKFYDHRSQFIVSSKSLQIVPGILVRCPVPAILRASNKNKIQLKIQLTRKILNKMIGSFDKFRAAISTRRLGESRMGDSELITSKIFPICPPVRKVAKISHNLRNHEKEAKKIIEKNLIIDKMLTENYVHNISVCSSITNEGSSPLHIIEFIEYYRLLGVSHFFLYDTRDELGTYAGSQGSIDNDDNGKESNRYRYYNDGLEDILEEYRTLGVITLVKWPNNNCHDDSSSTHKCSTSNTKANSLLTTAQASCFLRFRATSNWILSLKTINEFLLLYKYDRFGTSRSNYLANFIANYENENNKIIAFEFKKKTAVYCADGKNSNEQLPPNILSPKSDNKISKRENTDEETFLKPYRFGVYNAYISGSGDSNERLLVKTDRVSSIINEEIVINTASTDNSLVINLVSDLKRGGLLVIDHNSKATKALLSNIHNTSSTDSNVKTRPSGNTFQDKVYSNINSKEMKFKKVVDGGKNSENNLLIAEVNFNYGGVFSYFEMFQGSKGGSAYCTLSRDVNRIAIKEVQSSKNDNINLAHRVNEMICKGSVPIKDLSYLIGVSSFDSNTTFEDSLYLALVTRMTAVVEGSIPDEEE